MKMNTTPILPFYSSTSFQEAKRTANPDPLISPITQAIPFWIKKAHSASNSRITAIKLVNCAGTEIDVLSYFTAGSNLITSWSTGTGGSPYDDAFTSSGGSISSAIQAHAVASRCNSNTFTVASSGQLFYFAMQLTLNSGENPSICFADGTYSAKSNIYSLVNGWNYFTLRPTTSGTFSLQIQNNTITNWYLNITTSKLTTIYTRSLTDYDYYQYSGALSTSLPYGLYYFKVTDGDGSYYSEHFITRDVTGLVKITMTNSKDIGDLLYQNSLVQSCWLNTKLAPSEGKIEQIGDVRDGVLIIEKSVQSNIYRIIDWVSNHLYEALATLPAHDTITITDELGTVYTPNNVEIQHEQVYWDVCRVEIRFTANELVSTLNVDNMT